MLLSFLIVSSVVPVLEFFVAVPASTVPWVSVVLEFSVVAVFLFISIAGY